MSVIHQGYFDTAVSNADKQVLTLFDNLSDEELLALVTMERAQGKLVGFHEVGRHLHSLQLLTGNERYRRIVEKSQQ